MKRLALLLAALLPVTVPAQGPTERPAEQSPSQVFDDPPADARPMVRWWWFGPAVTNAEIDREIAAMKAGGFGGFEVQPTYPLSPDDPAAGIVNLPYLSPPFLAALTHAGKTGRALGMRVDVTIGSGWPFGGSYVPVTQGAMALRRLRLAVPAGSTTVSLPALGPGETAVALYLDGTRVSGGGSPKFRTAPVARQAVLYVAGRTGQQVKRPAVGAEGYVLDHLDAAAVRNHLTSVGDRLLSAFPTPPDAMFSDSLEAYDSSWTGDLPAEFRRRRGYDLLDHLPALFADGPDSAAVRHDWALTLTELVDERYLRPITAWAHAHNTRFRSQVYGTPPTTLSSNALVDLPEGEGADWRQFTSTRWATSAAHLYGRTVVSSETWTWLHSPAWAATPLDMKVEADRHFLQGVNQLVGHGWPYSPPGVAEPGWAFYAAAALNDHNPWYPAMPAVTRYLQRVSAVLRLGTPAADVAIYLPTEDAMAAMTPARASINDAMRARLGPDLVGRVLDAGQSVDFIDARAIMAGKLTHRVLVLPDLTRIDLAAYRGIADWVLRGGILLATGAPPRMAGGLIDGPSSTRAVATLSRNLFALGGRAETVPDAGLTAALRARAPAAVAAVAPDTPQPALGFVHRRLASGDLYFLANTAPVPLVTNARFAGDDGGGQWWDPVTGARQAAGTGAIPIRLAPYQSAILVFAPDLPPVSPMPAPAQPLLDLSNGWTARTVPAGLPAPPPGRAWTDTATLAHYSGAVRYSRTVRLHGEPKAGERLLLDVGPDRALPVDPAARPRAALLAPVRDAALVSINGRPAGTIWAPPWLLDVTASFHPGVNRIEVTVMNTATAALSARPAPDRRLLTARYGERFQDQDTGALAPTPAGLLGPIRLLRQR